MIQNTVPTVLSIDTSCDETAVALTQGLHILTNTIWSQASLHADFGGVFPSLAQRLHRERIDWVIKKALGTSKKALEDIDAFAVTAGPGLAIALEVGISKAKELSKKYTKPLIPINHIEGHILSPLAVSKNSQPITNYHQFFPALGVVTSGGHTEIILMKDIGEYEILATTLDDALGESLDKAARLLGFGYPGGAFLEKEAKKGDIKKYHFPIPMIGRENERRFSYSGIKTAIFRLLQNLKEKEGSLLVTTTSNIAASYQYTAFVHVVRVLENILKDPQYGTIKHLFAGGGVMANVTLRKMVRALCKKYDVAVLYPYSKKLYGDNAAMIGVAAYFKFQLGNFLTPDRVGVVDRLPRAKVDKPFPWE